MRFWPKNAGAWFNKGNALQGLDKYNEAMQAYDKAIEIDPNYVDAWFNKGTLLGKLGKNEDAKKCFDKVIQLT